MPNPSWPRRPWRPGNPHPRGPRAPAASATCRAEPAPSTPRNWRRRTPSTRCTRRATTGRARPIALLEMSGAGYLSSDITTFANCYGITLGNGQVSEVSVGGGGATGPGTAEAELDIDTVLSMAPKANIEVYEGGASDSLYDVFSRIVSDDTAKIVSASWTNGCEAYVGQSVQNSENTLFQAAAAEGQSIFVATGDQGSESCNINGEIAAATGSDPVAQAVDPSTGTLYIANKSSNSVSVDSEGSSERPRELRHRGLGDHRNRPGCRGARLVAGQGVHRQLGEHADGRLHRHLQPVDDERLQLADPGRLGRPPQCPVRPRRQRVHPLRGEHQRLGGGLQRQRGVADLGGDGEPALGLRADRPRRRSHQRLRLRRRRHQQPGRVLQRDDVQRDHARRDAPPRRRRSRSGRTRSPWWSPAARATSTWPTRAAGAGSRWSA